MMWFTGNHKLNGNFLHGRDEQKCLGVKIKFKL